MSFITNNNYTQNAGTSPTQPLLFFDVDPTSNDVNYKQRQLVVNTTNGNLWVLLDFSNQTGETQANWLLLSGQSDQLETLTGNSGGAVSGDANKNINIVGTTGQIDVTGTPGNNTLTLSLTGGGQAVDSFTTSTGGPIAPDANGNIALTGASSTFTNGTVANTIRTEVQGTNHALFVGRGTNVAATTLGVAANGQLPIGSAGADPVIAALTALPGIVIVNGAGSIGISTTSSSLPGFLVGLQAVTSNVTGNATLYTMVYDTIQYDQLTNFSGGTTFTVPANLGGLYQFTLQIAMQGIIATNTVGEIAILVNGSGKNAQFNPFNCADSSGRLTWNLSATFLLVPGDVVTTTIQISGGPGDNVDVGGSASFCFWSGFKTN